MPDTMNYTQEIAHKADARQWYYLLNDLENCRIVHSSSGVSSYMFVAVIIHLVRVSMDW